MNADYVKGLHPIGDGHYAYLQPTGTWGYSNAGLVVDGDQSLLVDTLFDERLTAEMLAEMQRATAIGAGDVTTLVNTHANGDHTYGNRLVANAEIIASAASAAEMLETPPEQMAAILQMAPQLGEVGEFLLEHFSDFDFAGVTMRPPTRTFEGRLDLRVGDEQVELIEVGPAHTAGDVIVHVPADRVVYTGDILFIEGTPLMWSGPVQKWIDACDRIIGLGATMIVPGHGPLTDAAGVAKMRGYLEFVRAESRQRFDAGMPAFEAALDITHPEYDQWLDAERIVVNVDRLYREFSSEHVIADVATSFAQMAQLRRMKYPRAGR